MHHLCHLHRLQLLTDAHDLFMTSRSYPYLFPGIFFAKMGNFFMQNRGFRLAKYTTDFQLICAGALLGCSFSRLRLTFLEKLSKEGYNTCIRLGLCDNSQMIPFLITGTDLFHRPLFFLSRQKHSLSFESSFKKQNSPVAILETISLQLLHYRQSGRPLSCSKC